jgi:hypothetical protein
MVLTVNQGDPNRLSLHPATEFKAPKTGSENDDVWLFALL